MSKKYFYYSKGRVTALNVTVKTVKAFRDSNGYYSVDDVINWFLSKDSMSPKKLQKLLYYAYAWTLTLGNESADALDNKLFNKNFEAWVHGPVIPSVYRDFKSHGFNNIPRNDDTLVVFDDEIEDVLNQVWEVYGEFNGNELESITHQETPWMNAREGLSSIEPSRNSISDVDIFHYYLNEMIEVDE